MTGLLTLVLLIQKMDGFVLEEKSSFNMLGLTFSSKLAGALTFSLLLKEPPRKLER